MRMLFFPSDLGGGFGHISRCMALAHEGIQRGHDCAFVINDRKYYKKIRNDFRVFNASEYCRWSSVIYLVKKRKRIIGLKSPISPIFTEISGLDYQVIRDGLIGENKLRKKLTQYLKIVRRFKPDVLIGDTNLLIWILSKKANVPVVQIVRYASHPKTAKLIWWKHRHEGMIPPDSSAVFNPLILKMGLSPINQAEDLLQGDLYIVPSIPEIEPIPIDEKTTHVGELTISREKSEAPEWFKEMNNQKPLVYITIGGGAGPVGNKLFFSTIVEVFADKDIQVVVSTSEKFQPSELPLSPKNIKFVQWVPGKLLISKADLVVFHGGYGTMMETVCSGKPSIILPFQTEQEGNGRRLEKLGAGHVIKISRDSLKKIECKWKYGSFNYFVQNRYDLTANEFSEVVKVVLSNKRYVECAKSLQADVKGYGGATTAIELVERRFG